jgi:hypothetical protein
MEVLFLSCLLLAQMCQLLYRLSRLFRYYSTALRRLQRQL